ncbi:hypothetical protein DPMN_171319 [Dreissena polymorpha]|uniref:Uncharacterized protein n=1 Tax=Dreissena polymorpha TaxID=45954 RepID=A0A9D4E0X2_DREPO|nr:hypothetical protein DPMN_171319 [Dreissena polymorpha]
MLYVLILAFFLSCVSCGERNALGLSARTNEDSVPLDPSRRSFLVSLGAVLVIPAVGSGVITGSYWGGRKAGWWKRGSTDVSLN